MDYFLLGCLLFVIGGLVAIFFKGNVKGISFLLFEVAAQFLILPTAFNALIGGIGTEKLISFSEPIGTAAFRLDALSAFFVIIISVGSLLAAVYSIGYLKHYDEKKYSFSSFYFFFGVLAASMLLVVVVQNAILFLIVWELMSVSSFFLVGFENEKEEVRKAGIYYLISMQIGASFLIAAFAWLSSLTGSYDFNTYKNILGTQGTVSIILFLLFFIGFGTKAGFVPFHTWLPRAHPAAPSGVSAIMSGVMIKTGIYGILRIILLSGIPEKGLAFSVFIIALITAIIGILNAISQKDIKKLLAYSSIENIGIIGMGIGLGMLGLAYNIPIIVLFGFFGALLHTLNHFLFKSILFYGAGIVYQKTGTRNMEKLGGLIKYLPITSIIFLAAVMAISGLPLLNGFISEFAIYLGMANSLSYNNASLNILMIIGFSGLALVGAMALIGFTKLFGVTFLGTQREKFEYQPKEANALFLIPMIFNLVFVFIIGLFPATIIQIISGVINQFTQTNSTTEFNAILTVYYSLSKGLLLFIAIFLFFFLIRYFLLRKREIKNFKTWNCGYQLESSRLQYTGSSYSLPFLELVAAFVPQKTTVETGKEIFPVEVKLKTSQHDFVERIFIQPMLKYVRSFLNLFAWVQSGRMQQYILYGLIFLVLILIWIIGVR
ncbi:MAG: hypothetical protein M1480_19560 [Bacteroidetes bacterium]|nr:hypothetical protein [Bacteroidota bacterium]